MTLAEFFQHADQQLHIISDTSHQMTSAQVQPFQFRQQMTEALFNGLDQTLGGGCTAFAQGMHMQPLDAFRQDSQLLSRDAEA